MNDALARQLAFKPNPYLLTGFHPYNGTQIGIPQLFNSSPPSFQNAGLITVNAGLLTVEELNLLLQGGQLQVNVRLEAFVYFRIYPGSIGIGNRIKPFDDQGYTQGSQCRERGYPDKFAS